MHKTLSLALYALMLFIVSCQSKPDKVIPEQRLLPGDGLGIGGVTLLVNNADSARNYYGDTLGFAFEKKFDDGLYEGTNSAALSFVDQFTLDLVGVKDTAIVNK